jgi:hypothetical protein
MVINQDKPMPAKEWLVAAFANVASAPGEAFRLPARRLAEHGWSSRLEINLAAQSPDVYLAFV